MGQTDALTKALPSACHRKNLPEMSMEMMRDLRKRMMILPSSDRSEYLALLSEMYAVCKFYPSDPILDEIEVVKSKQERSGYGGFADCWEGMFLGQHKVAMKAPRGRFEDDIERRLAREMKVWSRLSHPNVLPFLGLFTLGPTSYMISPWMENGDALSFVKRNLDADILQLLAQVAAGLLYLHTFNPQVIHGDLKGPNIFISESGDACIADFGLSELKVQGQDPTYSTPWYLGGHPRWQAPEILKAETKEQARRTTETDIFAFGRVMIELLTGCVPFWYFSQDIQVAMKVIGGGLPERPCDSVVVARGLDDDMWELMLACWDVDPTQRPSARDIASRLQTALGVRRRKESGAIVIPCASVLS